jgi:SAM-dependent methyltransferase
MPSDISWDEYNAAQAGRAPRASLAAALGAAGPRAVHDEDHGEPASRRPPVAIDLGCGEGVEVTALLEQGWIVHAVDGEAAALERLAERTPPALRERLHIHQTPYADVDVLPEADLVHASYSLPYCEPVHFHRLWAAVRAALRPGAVLACQLFGPHDASFGDPGMTFHTADEARALFDGLEIVSWNEIDEDGMAYTGPKHWHVFEVVARRSTG